MTAPESARWSRRTQRGMGPATAPKRLRPRPRRRALPRAPGRRRARVDCFAGGERARRASPQLGQERAELADDEVLRDLLVVDAERGQQVLLVAEVTEGAVSEVVQEAGHAQGLLDQRLRRRARLDLGQRGIDLPRQLAGQVHGAKAVREAAVLGRGEHPPRALQLVDALEPLYPRAVDDVRLGDLPGPRQGDAQAAVEGVGDQVDVVRQLHRPHPTAGSARRQGCSVAVASPGTSVQGRVPRCRRYASS